MFFETWKIGGMENLKIKRKCAPLAYIDKRSKQTRVDKKMFRSLDD